MILHVPMEMGGGCLREMGDTGWVLYYSWQTGGSQGTPVSAFLCNNLHERI